MKKLITLLFLLIAFTGFSQKKVKISMIYPGAGNTTKAVAKYNFIELHNVTDKEVDLTTWSLQYGSKDGNFASSAPNLYEFPTNTKIPAGGYLLVKVGAASLSGKSIGDIAPNHDLKTTEGDFTMSNSGGKVALVTDNQSLGCGGVPSAGAGKVPCDAGVFAIIEDIVAWGASTTQPETIGIAYGDPTTGVVRKGSGCYDTDNNAADFDLVANTSLTPRNATSTKVVCDGLWPVPVVLSGFSVEKSGNGVTLNWSTAQEQNSKEFQVERSEDQSNWTVVATVAANGNKNTASNYSAVDNNPVSGVNYYRLKMVDLDNSFSTSAIKSVVFGGSFAVSVSPNPASTYINVTLSGTNKNARIILSDINGKMVYDQTTNAPKLQINSSSFAKGMYILKVINGTDVNTTKVMVQ